MDPKTRVCNCDASLCDPQRFHDDDALYLVIVFVILTQAGCRPLWNLLRASGFLQGSFFCTVEIQIKITKTQNNTTKQLILNNFDILLRNAKIQFFLPLLSSPVSALSESVCQTLEQPLPLVTSQRAPTLLPDQQLQGVCCVWDRLTPSLRLLWKVQHHFKWNSVLGSLEVDFIYFLLFLTINMHTCSTWVQPVKIWILK